MKKNRDTKAERKIMDTLLDNIGGEKMYLSQIAKSSRVSISTCQQILERKAKEGEIGKVKLGNLSIYFLDPEFPKVRNLKIARAIELLNPLIEKLKEVSRKIILFGSASQGRDDVGSDFDIFILANDKNEVNKIISRSSIGRKIQPVIKNFLQLTELKEKNRTFYDEIMRGLVLWEEKNEE